MWGGGGGGARGSYLAHGEAGASYVNKWSNRTEELFLLFPPLISATHVYALIVANNAGPAPNLTIYLLYVFTSDW